MLGLERGGLGLVLAKKRTFGNYALLWREDTWYLMIMVGFNTFLNKSYKENILVLLFLIIANHFKGNLQGLENGWCVCKCWRNQLGKIH